MHTRTRVATAALVLSLASVAGVGSASADFGDSIDDLFDLGNWGAVLDPADQDAGASALATSLNAGIEQMYAGLHDQIEAAITNPVNAQLLDAINFPSVALFGRDLIGNGIETGDAIPALSFLDQSSGPLADTFTGTNEGLLTPALAALNVDVGSLHDGGFLFGDPAGHDSTSSTGEASHSAQELPPIACAGTILDPSFNGFGVTADAGIVCVPPLAGVIAFSDIFFHGLPVGIPGFDVGIGSANLVTSTLFCIPGPYESFVLAEVIFPFGYTPITPTIQSDLGGPVDITCTSS
jgi:hypothetical protein